jgi:uncharacterized protein YaiI (UPF0178 family)
VSDDGKEFKLPDIKDALRKKEIEEEIARMAEEEKEARPRIKRGDAKAFKKVRLSTCISSQHQRLITRYVLRVF